MELSTYLTFTDNCEEAFNFYKSVFGGEFSSLQRFGQAPPEMNVPEKDKDKIMHISLPIGSSTLMGSDSSGAFGTATVKGNNFSISLLADSEDQCKQLFEGLANGGQVTMPLQPTFWGALFGMLTDKYSINWMVNFDLNQGSNPQT